MAIGDTNDFLARIRNLLPNGWFPVQPLILEDDGGNIILDSSGNPVEDQGGNDITDSTGTPVQPGAPGPPTLAGFLTGCAETDAFIYSLISYAKLQTRIKTATDGWLDLIAYDFFGLRIQRQAGQSDGSFAGTIVTEVFRIRNTRPAIIKVLQDLTGQTPLMFNPRRDAASYNSSLYYNVAGLRGSPSIPFQSFVIAYRGNGVSDAQIYAAVESVRAEGTILWVKIQNP